MFGLLGPNGSGKTSTIRMMIGITVPDSGTVEPLRQAVHAREPQRVGYLPEERGLYKKMKVMDQLIFLGQLHGLDATTASKRAHVWCERMEITEAIAKKTEELSKGMQQKIQFIATLLHEPELIIMDEPFSGLDPVNAALLMDTLSIFANRAKPSSSPPIAWTRWKRSAMPSALIHAAIWFFPAACARSSRATRATVFKSLLKETIHSCTHPTSKSAKNYSGHAEIKLRSIDGAAPDAQPLLAEAIQRGTRITRFEVMEPTLEEIFIETVGENVDA